MAEDQQVVAIKEEQDLPFWKEQPVIVADHIIEIRSIKYKNGFNLDGNLFFFGAPEIQHSAVELSITNSMGDDERTLILHFHAAQSAGKSKRWLIGLGAGAAVLILQMVNYTRFKKQKMPTSIFLQQTRIYAQGVAVGALMLGAGLSIYQSAQKKKAKEAAQG